MAVTFSQENNNQKYLVYVLIVVILVIIFLIWLFFFKKSTTEIVPIEAPLTWKEIEINFKILENPLFNALENFEKIPEFQGEIGRENPFIPF